MICISHIPSNTKCLITESSSAQNDIRNVYVNAIDAQNSLIPQLLSDPDSIYRLTPDEFEEVVLDRLIAMNLQAFRLGVANRKDGGIDIIFWTRDMFPILGAVQVKHHRSAAVKVTSTDVRNLVGAMEGHNFNIGLLITNTSFTADAKHQAQNTSTPLQLRDQRSLQKWIANDFSIKSTEFVSRNAEFCRGLTIQIPKFG